MKFPNIAYAICKARTEKKISQEILAREIGYNAGQFVSNIERGLCSMPVKKIDKAAGILEINPGVIEDAMIEDYAQQVRFRPTVAGIQDDLNE